MEYTRTEVSAGQIKTLLATPVRLTPSPNPNYAITPIAISISTKPGATPYTMPPGNAQTGISIFFQDSDPVTDLFDQIALDNAAGSYSLALDTLNPKTHLGESVGFPGPRPTTQVDGKGIFASLIQTYLGLPSTGELTAGDGTMLIVFTWTLAPL